MDEKRMAHALETIKRYIDVRTDEDAGQSEIREAHGALEKLIDAYSYEPPPSIVVTVPVVFSINDFVGPRWKETRLALAENAREAILDSIDEEIEAKGWA